MIRRFADICSEKAANNTLANSTTSHCAAIISHNKIITCSINSHGGNNIDYNVTNHYCTTHAEIGAINTAIKKQLIPPLKGL